MPCLNAWLLAPLKANRMAALTGLILLCLAGCSPALIDQQDHGLSVKKALEAQRLPPQPRVACWSSGTVAYGCYTRHQFRSNDYTSPASWK